MPAITIMWTAMRIKLSIPALREVNSKFVTEREYAKKYLDEEIYTLLGLNYFVYCVSTNKPITRLDISGLLNKYFIPSILVLGVGHKIITHIIPDHIRRLYDMIRSRKSALELKDEMIETLSCLIESALRLSIAYYLYKDN